MKFFKPHITLLLLFTAISYSLDIHGLTHIFDDDHSDNSQKCQICIIHHQNHNYSFALIPDIDYKTKPDVILINVIHQAFSANQVASYNLFLEGQNHNRPPPSRI